jgi:hypothetical protein
MGVEVERFAFPTTAEVERALGRYRSAFDAYLDDSLETLDRRESVGGTLHARPTVAMR